MTTKFPTIIHRMSSTYSRWTSNRNMTGSDRSKEPPARNRQERYEFIKEWAEDVRTHPDDGWGEQVHHSSTPHSSLRDMYMEPRRPETGVQATARSPESRRLKLGFSPSNPRNVQQELTRTWSRAMANVRRIHGFSPVANTLSSAPSEGGVG